MSIREARAGWLPGLLVLLLTSAAIPAAAMSVGDVLDLLDAGVGDAVILDQIKAEDARFALNTADIIDLKEAGASDALIRAMIAREPGSDVEEEAWAEESDDWTAAYAAPRLALQISYDPFGYHWFGWPYYYTYYAPFPWYDCGFYYAGWWSHHWWRGGLYAGYWQDRFWWRPWSHVAGRSGRHAWSREPSGRVVGTPARVVGSRGRRVDHSSPAIADRRGDRRTRPSSPSVRRSGRIGRPEREISPRRAPRRSERPAWSAPVRPARPARSSGAARAPRVSGRPARAPSRGSGRSSWGR